MLDVELVGKTLFGNPTRLRLALWALRRDKAFFQSQPPRWVGGHTAVRIELPKLVDLEMLTRLDRPGESRIYYEVTDSPLWEIIRAAAGVLPDLPSVHAEADPSE